MSKLRRSLLQAAAGAGGVDTGDDDFANVVLLLDGDGTSDDNNNTFTDSSTNGFTVTENGSVVQGSFSPYGDNWSNYFNGSDYLSTSDSADFDLGSGNWTIECWFYRQGGGTRVSSCVFNQSIVGATSNSAFFFGAGNDGLSIYLSTSGSSWTDYIETGVAPPLNTWSHIAFERNGNNLAIYLNGTQQTVVSSGGQGASFSGTIYNSSRDVQIGSQNGGANIVGNISNLRVVKGTAVYTSNFTPATSPLTAITNTKLLTCQSNRFIDNSSSSHAISVAAGTPKVTPFSPFKDGDARDITTDGGSAYFASSSDYLSISDNSAFNFGTGDFTVEAWIYSEGGGAIWSNGPTSSGSFGFYFQGTNEIRCDYYGGTGLIGTTQAPDYAWHHVAVIRSGSTLSLYLNGVRDATTTTSSNNTTDSFAVGRAWTNHASGTLEGYIADLRVIKGTALYTGTSYTVPTAPLTAVTNTSALLNFQDAGIYDRSGINNLDTVGDARLGFAPIYGTGSLAFDGTGDYLSVQNENDLFTIGGGDYTVECWINTSDAVGEIVSAFNSSSPFPGWLFGVGFPQDDASKNGLLSFYQANSSNSETKYSTARVDDGSWHHVAASKSGTTLRFFIDGSLDSTHTLSYVSTGSGQPIRIGADNNTSLVRYLDGYLDDLRITKGVARYTSAFTPPTEIDLSTDTYAENVVFFLDGDGTANGQNNTFTDSSTNGATVTENGSVVQGVFSPYGDNWSNSFGNNNYYTAASDSSFNIGTGDFTVEAWVNPTQYTTYNYICTMAATGGLAFYVTGGTLKVRRWFVADVLSSSTIPEIGEWTHVAATRTGTTLRIFVNGVQTATTTDSTNYAQGAFAVGNDSLNDAPWYGNISNVRVLKGTALYTSNFTPPTSPLTNITNTSILTAQSNRFIDNSSNGHALTITNTPKITRFSPFESNKPYDITTYGGSGYFVSASDRLTVTESIGSGDFTIEFWAYTRKAGDDAFFDTRTVNNSSTGLTFTALTSSTVRIYDSAARLTLSNVSYLNQWTHFAVVRSSGTINIYVNGVSGGSVSNSTNYSSTAFVVGSSPHYGDLDGYLSDFRFVKGTAVYTSNFTPPTSPLTAATNTELLLNFQDAAIPDLSGLNNIDTVGNAKVGASDPTKYGSNAMQFDGSGDYLKGTASADELNMGTGDWTIEGWYYVKTRTTTYPLIIGNNDDGFNAGALAITHSNNDSAPSKHDKLTLANFDDTSARILSASSAHNLNQWYHFAVVRNGTSITIYRDGTSVASKTISSSLTYDWGLNGVLVGGGNWDGAGSYSDAYYDDLRITKGIARYTANFTAPTKALPKF